MGVNRSGFHPDNDSIVRIFLMKVRDIDVDACNTTIEINIINFFKNGSVGIEIKNINLPIVDVNTDK